MQLFYDVLITIVFLYITFSIVKWFTKLQDYRNRGPFDIRYGIKYQ